MNSASPQNAHCLCRKPKVRGRSPGLTPQRTSRFFLKRWVLAVSLCLSGVSLAAPVEMGRLFYTPTERAQLESARAHKLTRSAASGKPDSPGSPPPPLRYDGVLMRSDGKTTRWVDGKPQVGTPGVAAGLKPGQIRANGKVYEPYQVLRPTPSVPADPGVKESAP
jgi:hypothetical protein